MARQVLENGVILPAEYSDDWYDDMTSNLTKLDDVIGSDSEKLSSSDVGAAALSNNYNDLDNLPTIPTVNDATLTIQKNGVDVQTFTANASSNVTANITVPTKTSDLTNDSNFVDTSNSAVASGITSAKVTSYDSHLADTDIHVTAADKSKWNNGVSQSYVLRYSSSSVTDNSTIAYSTLDNTDNIKSGDKIIDVDGKIFSVVSVDTANQTVTVGSALIDLALDANVVHTSGNETVGGQKTFSDNLLIYNSDNSVDAPRLNIKTSKYVKGDTTNTDIMRINFLDASSNSVASIYANKNTSGTQYLSFQVYTTDNNNANITSTINYYISKNGDKFFLPYEDNQISLGGTVRRWKSVYATNYYYGSDNVEFSTKFVTTDTNQTISGNKTFEGVDLKLKSVAGEYTVSSGSTSLLFYDKNSLLLTQYKLGVFGSGISYQNFSILGYDSNNQQVIKSITFSSSNLNLSTAYLRPDTDNAISLGRNNNRWSDVQTYKVNALEPSSLSLPSDRSARIDISSYFIYTGNNATNDYSVSTNGYIFLKLNNINQITCYSTDSSSITNYAQTYTRPSDGVLYITFPVRKNDNFRTIWNTGSSVSIESAYFIPCQGNV